MTLTLSATVWPHLQGILLTVMALGFFVAAMVLLPKVPISGNSFWSLPSLPSGPAEPTPAGEAS